MIKKDEKICKLEQINSHLTKELNQALKKIKALDTELNIIKKVKEDNNYNLKLEMEERARKQMEMYSRELSIKFANAEDSDTIARLKEAGEGLLKEKKVLEGKVAKLEKLANPGAKTISEFKKLESNIILI